MVPRRRAVSAAGLLSLVVSALCTVCGGSASPPAPVPAGGDAPLQPGEIRQLDDTPLFVMRSSVDYGFDDYLRAAGRRGAAGSRGAAAASSRGAAAAFRPDAPARSKGWACTCFATTPAGEGPLFGRNFDWWHRASLLLYTTPKDALASLSMVDLSYVDLADTVRLEDLRAQADRVARRAPYVPFDGVNERGVAIGLMAVPSAQAPFDPARPSLYDLGLIRLVLDYATDAADAIERLRGCNYRVGTPPVHFLIADRAGAMALVEYVGGEMRVTRGAEPFMVATNFVVFGSQAPQSTGCWRYDRAYATLRSHDGVLSRAQALDLLSAVSQDITMWSAVYDLAGGAVDVVPGRRYGRSYRLAMDAR